MGGQEGEESERDREGQGSHGARLLWEEGEDAGGLVEGEPGEEQAWEGRVQEEVRAVEEEVRVERFEGLVRCREEGAQGARLDRLCRDRGQVRGWQGPLRQGEVLALSSPCCSFSWPWDMYRSADQERTIGTAGHAIVVLARCGRRAQCAQGSLYTHVAEPFWSRARNKG